MGYLGWTWANKERKRGAGEHGAVPPTGNPGLRQWLDCAAVGIALIAPWQLRRATATRSAQQLLAEEPGPVTTRGVKINTDAATRRSAEAGRKPLVL